MERKRICLNLPKGILEEMEKVKEKTGISISRQIELAITGYDICKKVN